MKVPIRNILISSVSRYEFSQLIQDQVRLSLSNPLFTLTIKIKKYSSKVHRFIVAESGLKSLEKKISENTGQEALNECLLIMLTV